MDDVDVPQQPNVKCVKKRVKRCVIGLNMCMTNFVLFLFFSADQLLSSTDW